jgi:WD40 repeat protein
VIQSEIISYSPNGKWLAAVGNGCIYVYSSSGALSATIPTTDTPYLAASRLLWSPDSSTLAVTGQYEPPNEGYNIQYAELFTISSLKVTVLPSQTSGQSDGGNGRVNVLAFSPDSKTLALTGTNPKGNTVLELWNVATGQLAYSLPIGATAGVGSLAFSADGKLLATAGSQKSAGSQTISGVLDLWTVATGQLANSLPTGANGGVSTIAFSADGKSLADGGTGWTSTSAYGVLEIWSLSSLAKPMTLKTKAGQVNTLAFSPDGTTLCDSGQRITGSPTYGADVIETWTISSGAAGKSSPYYATQLNYSPDGKTLYAATGGYLVSLPSTLASSPKLLLTKNNYITTFSLSPDGTTVACATYWNGAFLYSITSGKTTPIANSSLVQNVYSPPIVPGQGVAFNPAGTQLAVYGSMPEVALPGGPPTGLMLFNPASGAALAPSPAYGGPGGSLAATGMAWSADGKSIAYIAQDPSQNYYGTLLSWSNGAVSPIPTVLYYVNAVGYSPDGSALVDAGATTFSGAAEVRSVSGSSYSLLETGLDMITCLAISSDSQTLALGGSGFYSGVELWNLKTNTRISTMNTSLNTINGVALSPDGKAVAFVGTYSDSAGIHGMVEWWSTVGSHSHLAVVKTGTAQANCLCYSTGGGYVFVGTEQGVQIYSTANYGLTQSYTVLIGNGVTGIAMSPGGATFAYATGDGSVVMAKNPNAASDIQVAIEVAPGQVKGGAIATATITLSAPAPAGGLKFEISSNNPAAQPGSTVVNISAGRTSATVKIHTQPVSARTDAAIQVSALAVPHTATLTVSPK